MSSQRKELARPPLQMQLICLFVHVGPLYSASLIQSSLPSSRVLTSGSRGRLAATDLVQSLDLPVSSSCLFHGPHNVGDPNRAFAITRKGLTPSTFDQAPWAYSMHELASTQHRNKLGQVAIEDRKWHCAVEPPALSSSRVLDACAARPHRMTAELESASAPHRGVHAVVPAVLDPRVPVSASVTLMVIRIR